MMSAETKKTRHTPGPFIKRNSNGGVTVYTADKIYKLATIHHVGSGGEAILRHGERDGNGDLFAAAFEMLEALDAAEALQLHWENCPECESLKPECCTEWGRLHMIALKLREAAIAKARGKDKARETSNTRP